MATAKYQRHRDNELKKYMASLTPEQRELQKKAVKLDRLCALAKDKTERARLRAEHHATINSLTVLAYPPDGVTASLTGHDHKKEKKEVNKEDAENEGSEGVRKVQAGREAHP